MNALISTLKQYGIVREYDNFVYLKLAGGVTQFLADFNKSYKISRIVCCKTILNMDEDIGFSVFNDTRTYHLDIEVYNLDTTLFVDVPKEYRRGNIFSSEFNNVKYLEYYCDATKFSIAGGNVKYFVLNDDFDYEKTISALNQLASYRYIYADEHAIEHALEHFDNIYTPYYIKCDTKGKTITIRLSDEDIPNTHTKYRSITFEYIIAIVKASEYDETKNCNDEKEFLETANYTFMYLRPRSYYNIPIDKVFKNPHICKLKLNNLQYKPESFFNNTTLVKFEDESNTRITVEAINTRLEANK